MAEHGGSGQLEETLAAAVGTFQTLPCGTVKESTGVLTQRGVLRQSMCVRCQCKCISSPRPESNISVFVGPLFQLESL